MGEPGLIHTVSVVGAMYDKGTWVGLMVSKGVYNTVSLLIIY